LELHPDRVYRVSVRRRCVAEIKAPPQVSKPGEAAAALLALARKRGARRRDLRVSENVDKYLYGEL
jgi:hypothetical protein